MFNIFKDKSLEKKEESIGEIKIEVKDIHSFKNEETMYLIGSKYFTEDIILDYVKENGIEYFIKNKNDYTDYENKIKRLYVVNIFKSYFAGMLNSNNSMFKIVFTFKTNPGKYFAVNHYGSYNFSDFKIKEFKKISYEEYYEDNYYIYLDTFIENVNRFLEFINSEDSDYYIYKRDRIEKTLSDLTITKEFIEYLYPSIRTPYDLNKIKTIYNEFDSHDEAIKVLINLAEKKDNNFPFVKK